MISQGTKTDIRGSPLYKQRCGHPDATSTEDDDADTASQVLTCAQWSPVCNMSKEKSTDSHFTDF